MTKPHAYDEDFWFPDKKYSRFRRRRTYDYFEASGAKYKGRQMYCLDIDWVEWRNGNPVAIIETTRCCKKTLRETYVAWLNRNNGLQCEAAYRIAQALGVRAYIVLIDDPLYHMDGAGDDDEYREAHFHVCLIVDKKRTTRLTDEIGMTANEYIEWLEGLKNDRAAAISKV